MGPALATRSTQIIAGYASVAGNADVHNIHHSKGIFPGTSSSMAGIEKCPHASAARAAARIADDLAAAAKDKENADAKAHSAAAVPSKAAAAVGCPFHKKAAESSAPAQKAKVARPNQFNYEQFYDAELEKKHKDQSYRYFNNINRLAAKFPVAHTGNVKEEVEVWCANDYLGMGNNPVVLETMQYVQRIYHYDAIVVHVNF
jgi:5-aminolevulinate synthase